jgi:hypothetical protein
MSAEQRKTVMFGGVALALVLIAWLTQPRVVTPEVFADRGETLFPGFTDPNAAASLEVIEFDAKSATVKPFKVQNRDGRWTIPSQFDYPTDARHQLAQTAAAIIALKKDDFATDSAADHERTGVLDPVDTSLPTLTGRGTRVTVRGAQEQVLADVIVGNEVEGRPGFRYIRQPGQRRVYVSNVGHLTVSTAFADWIERNLMQVEATEIDAINIRNYALDRTTGNVEPGDTILLTRNNQSLQWTMNGLGPGEQVNLNALDALLKNLARLTISGVLPKPAGISATLSRAVGGATLNDEDVGDLRRKGFHLTPSGQLVSNRGEVVIRTTSGLFYTLRVGDIAPGTDAPAAPGQPAQGADAAAPEPLRENRYLFIMVNYDGSEADTPARAADGGEKVKVLRARFAPWYYVIPADNSAAIQLRRRDVVTRRG